MIDCLVICLTNFKLKTIRIDNMSQKILRHLSKILNYTLQTYHILQLIYIVYILIINVFDLEMPYGNLNTVHNKEEHGF